MAVKLRLAVRHAAPYGLRFGREAVWQSVQLSIRLPLAAGYAASKSATYSVFAAAGTAAARIPPITVARMAGR
jgi:hypothetical protein